MTVAPLHCAGQRLLLDPAGAIFWPARRTLIIADLHLEKASSFARRGFLLPPYDSQATLERLAVLLHRHAPERVIALGDSFHDPSGSKRLARDAASLLARMQRTHHFVWIAGNHDPVPGALAEFHEAPFLLRHRSGTVVGGSVEISGHFHPKARVETRAGSIARPCFVTDRRRILLPAFGSYTGGLDVSALPIRTLFPHGGQVFLLGRDRLFAFPMAQAARAV